MTRPIVRLFYSLVASGRFSLEGLTSHVFAPEQCAEAYLTANRDRSSTMGLIFDWAGILKNNMTPLRQSFFVVVLCQSRH